MTRFPDEIRLAILITINAIVICASVRFARRRGERDVFQIALDAMLLWYLTQYLSVTLPGIIGVLSASSMIGVAFGFSAILFAVSRRSVECEPLAMPSRAAGAVLIAFMFAVIWIQRVAPPMANDALTYHLPAAVEWLRTGKLGIFETWFHNPANSFSPLAGSAFIAWLMAPLGNDCITQFVQAPALIMIFLATVQLARELGVSCFAASLLALALCVSHPFISAIGNSKDDLVVVAFFATSLVGLKKGNPWRTGIALGLMLACKYTTLILLPILLLARWTRRDIIIAVACVPALAGPWYLRNLLMFGNPIFPMFSMFVTTRSREMSKAFWRTDSVLPIVLSIAALAGWLVTLTRTRKRMPRVLLFGPAVGIAIFSLLSPYPKARFIYPCYLLLFIASSWMAPVLLIVSIATSFAPGVIASLCIPFVIALAALIVVWRFRIMSIVAVAALAMCAYIYWPAYLQQRRSNAVGYWRLAYGQLADAWEFARASVPVDATIAYTNTSFVYPLMNGSRQVIYVPVREDVRTIADIPHLDGRITGEDLVDRVVVKMNEHASEDAWLRQLHARNVHYLFIAKSNRQTPELQFVEGNSHFSRVYDNEAASVYKID